MGDLLVIAGVGWKDGVVGSYRIGIDMASPAGRALQTRQVVLIPDIHTDPTYRRASLLQDHEIRSVLNAPIPMNGGIWGVIEADGKEPDTFDLRDQLFLETFAFQLGTAIRHQQDLEARAAEVETTARRLAERELLAREEHHRVKNYFQIIMAMMTMKAAGAATEHSRQAFESVMDRVMAVSLAHDLLVSRDGPATLCAGAYIRSLCSAVERAGEDTMFKVEAQEVDLQAEQAIPLGLILNELLTNALKYAAKDRPGAVIQVRFGMLDPIQAHLVVADNGPGMPSEPRRGSTGLGLVKGLANQLGGRITVESSHAGTTVSVCFPIRL